MTAYHSSLLALPLLVLAGCQAAPPQIARPDASLPAIAELAPVTGPVPADCPRGRTARLSDGLIVEYRGADPNDPGTCLLAWNGRSHRFAGGVLATAPRRRGNPAESRAIRAALRGPVGTKTEFQDTAATLWGRVTVEHTADPALRLGGGWRRTAQLRIVRHDAHGRPQVRQVTLHWVDLRTGIVLRRQVVTELEDGQLFATDVWRVESLG